MRDGDKAVGARRREGRSGRSTQALPLDMAPEDFRALGHRLVDRLADFLAELPSRPVAPDVTPEAVREALGRGTLPEEGREPAAELERAFSLLVSYSRLTAHPRQWGYIIGSAAPVGALADLVAATLNANVVAWASAPMATEIELQAVAWLGELLGYPVAAGLFTSGGNAANFLGFLAARRARAGWNVRAEGVRAGPRLRVYVSRETHTWIEKAADAFGLGTDAVRWIDTDGHARMDPAALERAIDADLAAGEHPFLIVGTAGTVSTGAVDPLPRLAAIARRRGLWFHVDGAYGAPAILAEDAPPDLAGLREADSLAVDAHKWLHAPLEAGCTLVRDPRALADAFAYHPPYYASFADGEDLVNFHELGLQNSRAFRAFKVWLALASAGRRGYAELVARDLALARRLHERLAASPEIEALTRGLSIVTFRYAPAGVAGAALDDLNRALVARVHRSGEAYVSHAQVDGRFALRACITNFRSREADVDALPGIVRRLGAGLAR